MEKGKAYWGKSEDQPPSTFSVVSVIKMMEGCLPTMADWEDYIFYGESDKASTLFGWAVTRLMLDRGQDIMLVFNSGDEIVPPEGTRLK